MNINNREEALRAKGLAEGLMQKSDFSSARKLAVKAHNMDPTLENISHMTMVCDVHCAAAAEKMLGNEMDWYGILQVDMNANDIIIKKQYRKLALLLHPDKNKLPGAESAFKLIGEAQRMLLDKEKRMVYDVKRKASIRRPAPSYRTQQVPSYRSSQQASVHMRSVFDGLRPQAQQPPGFTLRPSFWTSCPFCGNRWEYGREHVKREMTCRACKKQFIAFEVSFVPPPPAANSSYQKTTSSFFPQQGQKACPEEPYKRPDEATGSTAENNKGKRKRKDMDEESIESSDSESSSDSEDDDTMAAGGMGSNDGQEPRRSVRSKRKVSYNESLSDDDDGDLANNIGEAEPEEDEKQTHDDHHQSTETLPNGINPKEKKIEESLDDWEEEESSLGGEAAEPNLINCDDPEFSDFDKLREKSCFHEGQVWALYDEGEGMPRFYAVIRKVTSPSFSVKYVWLEAGEDEEDETRDLPVSVGRYVLGDEAKTNSSTIFSHLVRSKTRSNARNFTVFPGRGETWALFKNCNVDDSGSNPREYEFVEILSDHAEEGATISVGFLFKVEGFKYVYSPMPKEEADIFEIPPHEFFRFSHRVPSFRLKGTEGRGVLEGWYELDPAALPGPGSQEATAQDQDQDQEHQSPPPSGSAC
ncbi:hypothetical protein N665_0209s0045 [Sinapis alba]|nr:hypothetical protein N665_0209s0045 [Sinapis alba]